jgi:hypothetical protein
VIMLPPRLQRTIVVVILAVPLLMVVLLSAPAWLVWPFLPKERRATVLEFLDHLVDWVKVLAGTDQQPQPHEPTLRTAGRSAGGPSASGSLTGAATPGTRSKP